MQSAPLKRSREQPFPQPVHFALEHATTYTASGVLIGVDEGHTFRKETSADAGPIAGTQQEGK